MNFYITKVANLFLGFKDADTENSYAGALDGMDKCFLLVTKRSEIN